MVPKIYVVWIGMLLILGTLLFYGSRWYLPTQADKTSVLQELQTTCPQPCWQGVQPGQTLVEDKEQLPKSTHFSVDYYTSDAGLVQTIYLYARKSIRLGDLILLWGEPSHVVTYGTLLDYESIYTNNPSWATGVELFFHDSLVTARGVTTADRITPDLEITNLTYNYPSEYGPARPLNTPLWQGFFADYPILYTAGGE